MTDKKDIYFDNFKKFLRIITPRELAYNKDVNLTLAKSHFHPDLMFTEIRFKVNKRFLSKNKLKRLGKKFIERYCVEKEDDYLFNFAIMIDDKFVKAGKLRLIVDVSNMVIYKRKISDFESKEVKNQSAIDILQEKMRFLAFSITADLN